MDNNVNVGKIVSRVVAAVFALAVIFSMGQIFENLDAKQIMVIQAPISGKLTWYTTPGVKWQGFGSVTKYEKRSQYWFSAREDQGAAIDQSIKVRYNDGGHANVSGSFAWEMPLDEASLTAIHTKYGSQSAIEQQLVRTTAEKAVYMSGPLMSSTESYAERRSEFLNIVEDQLQNGVYVTHTITTRPSGDATLAAIQGQSKTIVQIVKDDKGLPLRQEQSPLTPYNIKTTGLSINEIKYDNEVENQIAQQQKAVVEVQIQAAQAKKAEQKRLTAEKEGEAEAMASKWKQEVIKAQATTEAEQKKSVALTEAQQKLEVAKLDKESAEQFKQAETLRGEGEAARRKLVMEADGALDRKLEAWTAVNSLYAKMVSDYKGNLVPSVIMGNGNGTNQSSVMDLIDLIKIKTAKDLGLDMTAKTQTAK